MTAFDIVTEVKRYHVQVKDPESTDEGWCKGCESDWPCDTQRLVDEIEASRKKLAEIRAATSTFEDDWPGFDPNSLVDEIWRIFAVTP